MKSMRYRYGFFLWGSCEDIASMGAVANDER